MKKVIRIFGLAMVVAALLVVSIGGAALAASGSQLGDGVPDRVGAPNGDCICDCLNEGECEGDCNCLCECSDGEPSWVGPLGEPKVNNYGGPH